MAAARVADGSAVICYIGIDIIIDFTSVAGMCHSAMAPPHRVAI